MNMKKRGAKRRIKKAKIRNEIKVNILLAIIIISSLALIYYLVPPTFTGYTILESSKWDALNISNFNYNENEIEILDGAIKLKSNISSADWTTYSQETFALANAYYKPDDKTSKVLSQDNNTQDISSGELTIFIFDSDLNNGDIINLYLKEEESTNIYLCNAYEECTSSNLGQVNFPDQDGYYQITVQNLNSISKVFNLNSNEEIKLDFINSTNANITKFWHDHKDKASKVNSQNNETQKVSSNEIFDLVFDQGLQDSDVIQLYLKNEEATDIYLCSVSDECTSSNLGSFSFPNQQGYYNLTVQNLNSISKVFNLNSDEEIKLDFIEAIRVTETNHSETNITYPASAEITANDFSVADLNSWDILITEEVLNGQDISYEYSTDSGESWIAVSEDKNLSDVNSTKIKIKAVLNSNGTATPELLSLNLTYILNEENENEAQDYYEANISSQIQISTRDNSNIIINSSEIKTELTLLPSETLDNIGFSISLPAENHSSTLSRLKEIEITAPGLNNNLRNATIRIYYKDEDIAEMNESTLKIYYFNETLHEWQERDSTVDAKQNFVEAEIEHFSIYGIFGESNSQESASSQSSSGSGGSGGSRTFTRGSSQQETQERNQQVQEVQQEQQENEVETSEQTVPVLASNNLEINFTGNAVRVLTSGKLNQSLIILAVILIVAYIIVRLNEKK